jgi:hypothetical protein
MSETEREIEEPIIVAEPKLKVIKVVKKRAPRVKKLKTEDLPESIESTDDLPKCINLTDDIPKCVELTYHKKKKLLTVSVHM